MPIKDLSENNRMLRLGKFHLGIRHPEKGYPIKTEYFVMDKENSAYGKLVEAFGEKPKELRILIPVEDEEQWASQYYKSYNQTYGLVCKGDGEMAMRMVDIQTGELPDKNKPGTVTMKEMQCAGRDCPEYKSKMCKMVMNLQFILPEVPGLGIWQIDTSSINSILNINSCARLIKKTFGRISLIPLKLTLEPMQVNNPETGKKQTAYVLNLRTDVTLAQLADAAREQHKMYALEMPDYEELWGDGEPLAEALPEANVATGEIIEQQKERQVAEIIAHIVPEQEPNPPVEPIEPVTDIKPEADPDWGKTEQEEQPPERDIASIKTLTNLYRACCEDWPAEFKTSKDVLKELGVTAQSELTDAPAELYARIAAVRR